MDGDEDRGQQSDDMEHFEDPAPSPRNLKRKHPDTPSTSYKTKSNKIILGSKPQTTVSVEVHTEPKTSKNRAGTDSSEDFEITPFKKRNIAKKSTTKGAVEAFKKNRAESTTHAVQCNHCNKLFTDQSTLIAHLYEELPMHMRQERKDNETQERRQNEIQKRRENEIQERRQNEMQERGENATQERGKNATQERRQNEIQERGEKSTQERRENEIQGRRENAIQERRDNVTQERRENEIQERGEKSTQERRENATHERGEKSTQERRENATQERRENATQERRENEIQGRRENEIQERRENEIQERRENVTQERRENVTQERRENVTQERRENVTQERRQNVTQERRENVTQERRENVTQERRENEIQERRENEIQERRQNEIQKREEKETQERGQKQNKQQARLAVEETRDHLEQSEPPRGEAAGEGKLFDRSCNRYRCVLCKVALTGLRGAERHRRTHHPGQRHVIKKLRSENTTKHNAAGKQNVKATVSKPKMTVFYCSNCNNCTHRMNNIHLRNYCTSSSYVINEVCVKCGLSFSIKSMPAHMKNHAAVSSLHDIEILAFSRQRIFSVPMPMYHRCEECGVNYESRKCLKTHKCGSEGVPCDVCGKILSEAVYPAHASFHKYVATNSTGKKNETTNKKVNKDKALETKSDKINEEVTKRVGKTVETPHQVDGKVVLYKCSKCSIVITKKSLCQKHSCRSGRDTRHCQTCDQTYAYYQRHAHYELHNKQPNLTPDKIHIEYFDENSSVSEKKEKNNDQIAPPKRDKTRKNIEMVEPRRKYKVFRCRDCSCCVNKENNIPLHKCVPLADRRVCTTCKQTFHWRAIGKHRSQHEKFLDYFEHKIFVQYFEPKATAAIPQETTSLTEVNTKNTDKDVVGNNKLVIYKCKDCSAVVFRRATCRKHKCVEEKFKRFCEICKQQYICQQAFAHRTIHAENPNLTSGNFEIIHFKPAITAAKGETKQKTPKTCLIYKCECNVHFLSQHSWKRHLDRKCDGTTSFFAEKCNRCDKMISTDDLVTHINNHHGPWEVQIAVEETSRSNRAQSGATSSKTASDKSNINLTRSAACTDSKLTDSPSHGSAETSWTLLFKCEPCNVYFTRQSACHSHVTNHVEFNVQDYIGCKLCSLQFPVKSLPSHMKQHARGFDVRAVIVERYEPVFGSAPRRNTGPLVV